MNKILLILLLFLSSCGYQPIYLNKNLENIKYSKINLIGDGDINKKIINTIPVSENGENENLNQLFISSSYKIEPASKSSKGLVNSFRTIVDVSLKIKNSNNDVIQNKNFVKQFIYNKKQNNFELIDYQNSIKDDLVDIIISEIIIFLNS